MKKRMRKYLATAMFVFCLRLIGGGMEAEAKETEDAVVEVGLADTVGGHALDISRYREHYPDLEEAFGADLDQYVMHYAHCGINEGRENFDLFNPIAYADANPDVKEACGYDKTNLILHYLLFGIRENRPLSLDSVCRDTVPPRFIVLPPPPSSGSGGDGQAETGNAPHHHAVPPVDSGGADKGNGAHTPPPSEPDSGADADSDFDYSFDGFQLIWTDMFFNEFNWIGAEKYVGESVVNISNLLTQIEFLDASGEKMVGSIRWELVSEPNATDGNYDADGICKLRGVITVAELDSDKIPNVFYSIPIVDAPAKTDEEDGGRNAAPQGGKATAEEETPLKAASQSRSGSPTLFSTETAEEKPEKESPQETGDTTPEEEVTLEADGTTPEQEATLESDSTTPEQEVTLETDGTASQEEVTPETGSTASEERPQQETGRTASQKEITLEAGDTASEEKPPEEDGAEPPAGK